MSNSRSSSGWRSVSVATGAYLLLTLVMFRNLLPAMRTHVYADPGDPLLNTAILLWNAKVVPLSSAWWNFPSFAPLSGVTAWTEHLLGAYPITSPIIWATGNAVLAYNTMEIVCFPLNALSVFLLVRELTGSSAGAFVGGLAFAFAPYVGENASHLQMLMAFGMPFALYSLHRYLRTSSGAALFGVAVGWVSALASSVYLLVFFPILVALWCACFLRKRSWKTRTAIGATLFVASLPFVPLLWGYYVRQAAYGFERPYSELVAMSAPISGLIGISHRAVLWRGVLPDTFYEGSLFPGLCVMTLTLVALGARLHRVGTPSTLDDRDRSYAVWFYLAAAVVMWSLTLGPEPRWSGSATSSSAWYGPYWALLHVPGGQSIRVPARAWLVAATCLAVCSGIGASWLTNRVKRRSLVVVLSGLILAEGWFVDQISEVPSALPPDVVPSNAIVLDLPLYRGYENAKPQYLAVLSGYRTVNGYSGYAAPHFAAALDALAGRDPVVFNAFRRRGDLFVIVRPEVDRPSVEWLEAQEGVERLALAGDTRVYRLPRQGSGPAVSPLTPLPKPGEAGFSIP